MKDEMKDLKAIAQSFFTAYDAHDVDGMTALCADNAEGRYLPLGRNSVKPIRGGIDFIWKAFPQAVPLFRVEVVELITAERNTVVVQWGPRVPRPALACFSMFPSTSPRIRSVSVCFWAPA